MSVIETPAPAVVEPPVTDPAYEAALRGADFLDRELGPNWEDRINPATLAMHNSCRCVVGQLYGDYNDAITGPLNDSPSPILLGFFFEPGESTFSQLTRAWKRVLAERRKARES